MKCPLFKEFSKTVANSHEEGWEKRTVTNNYGMTCESFWFPPNSPEKYIKEYMDERTEEHHGSFEGDSFTWS